MYSHSIKIRVRFGETDQMGYMHHGNYALYYEEARIAMLRNLGMTYSSIEERGIMMPVLEMKSKYLKPAFFDQEITVKAIVKTMPSVRMVFEYELYNEKDELINQGETTLVFVDKLKNRPTAPPAYFLDKILPYFQH